MNPIIYVEGKTMKTKFQTFKQFKESKAGKELAKKKEAFFKKHSIKGKNMTPARFSKLTESQKNEFHALDGWV